MSLLGVKRFVMDEANRWRKMRKRTRLQRMEWTTRCGLRGGEHK